MTDEERIQEKGREMARKIKEYTGREPHPSEELKKQIKAFWEEREKQKKQSGK